MKRKLEFSKSLNILVRELSKLPGVGPKSAERFAFHILRSSKDEVNNLSRAIIEAKEKLTYCKICGNLSEEKICQICQDALRDKSRVCVVEEPNDVLSIEKTGIYKGLYHVLLGSIAPLDGIGPHELRIKELISRVKNNKIKEVIIATSSDTEGEITALYLAKVLRPYSINLSRLAAGMPVGAELNYADEVTLGKAIENRIRI
ncbi:MAG: recombination protein RecR [Desulfobacteraceae bacterium]|nr:recombination protein RecR [Desulfobacteraceae bacterium]